MLSIHLHNVIIHAYHGVYAEEKVLGNDFLVDVSVDYHPSKYPITSIEDTIDYVALHDLVKTYCIIRENRAIIQSSGEQPDNEPTHFLVS